jgi:small conductance mechanosensitive channel
MSNLEKQFNLMFEQFLSFQWISGLIIVIVAAFAIGRIMSFIVPRLVRMIAIRADNATETDKLLKWRRIETMLYAILAAAKMVIFVIALYVVWRVFKPTSAPLALVSASAIFAILASATLGSLLRDLTYGTIMILERWYNVGDYITVEPFGSVSGVVELVTLRSTKLRNLKGEIVWLHNQHIQGVKVAPRGVRLLAIDIFVSDPVRGRELLKRVLCTLPTGPMLIVKPFEIEPAEKIDKGLYVITASGQTAPGREWLVENFAVDAVKKNDESSKNPILISSPIVRFADEAAERYFKRSVRVKPRKAITKL